MHKFPLKRQLKQFQNGNYNGIYRIMIATCIVSLLPIVSRNWQINKRFLFYPSQIMTHSSHNCTKLGKQSPLCAFGLFIISLHYVLQCILTSSYHVEKPDKMLLHDWVTYILHHPVSYLILLSNLCIWLNRMNFFARAKCKLCLRWRLHTSL